MADVKAAREQLIAELDRSAKSADAKDAADRLRALRDLEAVDFDTLYGNIDLSTAHASVIDQLTVHLNRAGVALRSMQKVEGERLPDEAQAIVDEQKQIPVGVVSNAKSLDEAIDDGLIEPSSHRPTGRRSSSSDKE